MSGATGGTPDAEEDAGQTAGSSDEWWPTLQASILIAIGTVATAAVIAWLSLHNVPGVERYFENGRRRCCHTTFVHDDRWASMVLLALPSAVIARRSLGLAVGVTLASSVWSLVVAHEVVHRYAVTGWGDGLEVFAYVEAVGMTVLWVIAALVGRATRPRARSSAVNAA